MHFFNPVPVMQLVEIIRALQTADEVCTAIEDATRAIGKTPHQIKDSYGFVVNRVLVPMINEAINCLYEGLTAPEEIDAVMRLGANHPMGPLSLADLIGLDIVLDIMETLYQGFDDPKYRPSPLLKQMVDAGYLGRKTGRGFFRYARPHKPHPDGSANAHVHQHVRRYDNVVSVSEVCSKIAVSFVPLLQKFPWLHRLLRRRRRRRHHGDGQHLLHGGQMALESNETAVGMAQGKRRRPATRRPRNHRRQGLGRGHRLEPYPFKWNHLNGFTCSKNQ